MSVFQQIVDVSGTTTYPIIPQVIIPFECIEIVIVNQDTVPADDVFASFDGIEDHVQIFGSDGVTFSHQRIKQVWLRKGSAGASPTNVQVIAES